MGQSGGAVRGSQAIAAIVIGGASGLVGRRLAAALSDDGQTVHRLVRGAARGEGTIAWRPEAGQIDGAALEDCDAVIHLGGESIAGSRWTAARKTAIRDSRVVSTRLLSETLARLNRPPRVFVCASAVGYYGARGDEPLTEDSPPGTGFLSDVCQAWEAATARASSAGIRVVNARFGVVLARDGGALAVMLPAFRWGVAGVLGDGRQVLSWIALADAVAALRFALGQDTLRGPVNVTAPGPVTNREFTRTLGRVLRRPAVLPAPGFAVRILLGEMGKSLLLEGQRAIPRRLTESGFKFRLPNLEAALRSILDRP